MEAIVKGVSSTGKMIKTTDILDSLKKNEGLAELFAHQILTFKQKSNDEKESPTEDDSEEVSESN